MNKTIAKLFYKNKYVILNVAYPNRKVLKYYEVPKNNIVAIKDIEQAFTIDEERVIFINGIANYFYNSNSPTPLNFYPTNEELQFIELNPQKLYAGIENGIINEIFNKFGKSDSFNLSMLLSLFTLLLILGIAVYMFISFKDLNEVIQKLVEQITGVF